MKKNIKKILLPILGFSTIVVSMPIIATSCSKSPSYANIINFDDFTPLETNDIKTYSFASSANNEWRSKTKDNLRDELNLTNSFLPTGVLINQYFKDEEKFKSMINGLTFSIPNSKNLSWTEINVSALNNPNAKVSLTYFDNNEISFMTINWEIINWELGSDIKVIFTLID